MRWHCPPDTRFEIRALTVWGQVRYLSAIILNLYEWAGKKYLFVLKPERQSGGQIRDLQLSKQAAFAR